MTSLYKKIIFEYKGKRQLVKLNTNAPFAQMVNSVKTIFELHDNTNVAFYIPDVDVSAMTSFSLTFLVACLLFLKECIFDIILSLLLVPFLEPGFFVIIHSFSFHLVVWMLILFSWGIYTFLP
jgi:hypothetical protein